MTLREYQIRMEAYQLQEIATQQHLWQLAFYTRDAKSNNGKRYKFKGPDEVFDVDKAIDSVRSHYEDWYTSDRLERISIAKQIQQRQKEWELKHRKEDKRWQK